MTEVLSRPRGRPPKVRPQANEAHDAPPPLKFKPAPAVLEPAVVAPPPAAVSVPTVAAERMVEVMLVRKYAPAGQTTEIMKTVPYGTVMKLPVLEATRALKLGIALATDETFS